MNSGLKIGALALLALLSINACKKTGDPAGKSTDSSGGHVPSSSDKVFTEPGTSGMITHFNYSQQDVDSLSHLPAAERPADAKSAMDYWISTPPKLPIAPHLLPVEHVTSLNQTDSTAMFSADASHAPISMIVSLTKKKSGATSVWVVTKIEEGGHANQQPQTKK